MCAFVVVVVVVFLGGRGSLLIGSSIPIHIINNYNYNNT